LKKDRMEGGASKREERTERWRAWMAAAQQGDAEAYQRLLTELLPFVSGVVRGRVGDDPAAEDIVQEVLLSIHTARHTYRSERPLEPWVRTIARNAVIDWIRKRARARGRESGVDAADLPAPELESPSALLSPGVERALTSLPEAQRQAVVMLKLEGLTVAEAAERVGTTPGALKLRAHRGYRALRDLFGRELV
jgi:RNA polymerase sigma-70 factor (ECF subfamily)